MNGYELIDELARVIKECLCVPNEKLPESFRDNRTDCVSLADLENKCDGTMTFYDYSGKTEETDHQEEKREKARRVELYREMIENGQEITYLMKGM